MRLSRAISVLTLAMTLAAVPAQATTGHSILDLHSLLGDWIGRSDQGEMVHASFRIGPDGRIVQLLRARRVSLMSIYGSGAAGAVSITSLTPPRTPPRTPARVHAPAVAPVSVEARAAAPDNVSFVVDDGAHHTETWTWRQGNRLHSTTFYFTRESEMF